MDDSTRFSRPDLGRLPYPTVFDASMGGASAPDLGAPSTVVLLLVASDRLSWAAETAVSLGAAWARDGRRIVLADLHLESPTLHEQVGLSNLEGMVDIFLYGASIARSARPVRGAGFYLISAGTYETDADAIYHHPRWPKLVAGFRDADASLVLFAPLEGAGLDALARWADRVVLLGQPRSPAPLEPLRERGVPVDAVLVPQAEEPVMPPVEAALAAPEYGSPSTMELPASDLTLESPSPRREEHRELTLPPSPERPAPRRHRRWWPLLLAVLIGMGLLGWLGYVMAGNQPGLFGGPVSGSGEKAGAATPGRTRSQAPGRAGEALPFSVQVKAFSSFAAARQELGNQQGRFAAVPFFVSPEEVQGVLYFKVLAGLAADTAEANRLQGHLIDSSAINPEDAIGAWSLIRPTPFAFDLGEFRTPEQAGARADSLLSREIPSYAVPMPYTDGSRRWQLYGGAYPDSASAEAMRQRLITAGVLPRLVLRLGQPSGGEAPAAQ